MGTTSSNPSPRTAAFKPGTVTIQLDTIDTEVPEAQDYPIHPLIPYCGVPLIPAGASHVANAIGLSSEPSGLYHFHWPSPVPSHQLLRLLLPPPPFKLPKNVSLKKLNTTLHEQLQEKPNCIAKALLDFLNPSSLCPRRAAFVPCAHPTNKHRIQHTYPLALTPNHLNFAPNPTLTLRAELFAHSRYCPAMPFYSL